MATKTKPEIRPVTLVLLLAIACTAAAGRTIYVDNDGPADFNNIQAAIDDSNVVDGDTIIVYPGTYTETINFNGKNIILRSTEPTNPDIVAATVIDGGHNGSVVTFNSGETNDAVLEGFTITRGHVYRFGGGICCERSTPTICYNIITGNVTEGGGGGIYSYTRGEGGGTIKGNIIWGNWADYGGGGIALSGNYTPMIIDNIIMANRAQVGGGIFMAVSGPTVLNNLIVGNVGGGLYLEESWPDIVNNVIADNEDYGVHLCWNEGAKISNCVIWHNDENNIISEIPIHSRGITYNDIQGGWPEEGNIDADPLFVNPNPDFEELESVIGSEGYERAMNYLKACYHLKSQAGRYDPNSQTWVRDPNTSPCIDTGDPMTPIGPEPFPNGGIVNMGAYGGTAEASKSYFGKPPCEIIVAGDINGDCIVDFRDAAITFSHWLEDNSP